MNDESLEKMGEEVRRVVGDQPDEARRKRQRAAVAGLEAGSTRSSTRWWLAPVGMGAAAAVAWFVWPSQTEVTPAPVVAGEEAPRAPADTWVKAPKDASAPIELGPHARGTLHAGAKLRVTDRTDTGARLLLETGRLDLDVEPGADRKWIVVAGPYETRALGTEFSVDWFPIGEDLAVEVTHGEVSVSGAHLGADGMVVEAGKVLEASLRDESATLRSKRERDLELDPPRFEGRIPDVENDPVLARTWASYYLQAHPDGDQIDVARELFLRSFAQDRGDPQAREAAEGYLEVHPEGEHATLAHEILQEVLEGGSREK